MAVERVSVQDDETRRFWTWRYSREDRFGTCPSLLEAFMAGSRTAPRTTETERAEAYEAGRAQGHQEGHRQSYQTGYHAGHAKGLARGQAGTPTLRAAVDAAFLKGRNAGLLETQQARERTLPMPADVQQVLQDWGLGDVRFSGREAQIVALLASLPNQTATPAEIEQTVWRRKVSRNMAQTYVARIRAKLPAALCIGVAQPFGYRLHRVGQSQDCRLNSSRPNGQEYTPTCRQPAVPS